MGPQRAEEPGTGVTHKKEKYICKTSCLGELPAESDNMFRVVQSLTPKEKLRVLAGSRALAGAKEGCSALARLGPCVGSAFGSSGAPLSVTVTKAPAANLQNSLWRALALFLAIN